MAEKLSITIALEGGKAIEQQLEGIGKAGQKAFDDIKKSAEAAGGFKNLKPEEVTAKLKEMGVVGQEALGKITGAVQSATRLESMVGIVQKVEAGFAGLATAAKLFGIALVPLAGAAAVAGAALVKGMTDAATAISKADAQAIKLGLSIEKFSQLKQGFEAAGLATKAVESGMAAIGKAIEQAKLDEVTSEVKKIKQEMSVGLSGVGLSQFQKLIDAAQGVGKAADLARKALAEFGIETGKDIFGKDLMKSLPQFINKMGGDVPKAVAAFVEQLRAMPDSANRSAQAIAGLDDAGVGLVQAFRTGAITADQFRARLTNLTQGQANTSNALEQSFNRLNSSWENLKTTFFAKLGDFGLTSAIERVNTLLQTGTWESWGAAAKEAFVAVFGPLGELEVKLAKLVGNAIWEGFKIAGVLAMEAISNAADDLINKLKSIGSAIAKAGSEIAAGGGTPGDVGPIPGNARGGLLGGRGSGTSDSNLAWVSRGEHIMPAHAVRQPGVLALLEALRRSGGNLRGVLDGMGRFAAGGVVPRFAEGGLVGGIGHLGTVDLRTDHGSVRLMAGASAVEQLSRLAVTKRMTSTGKKPGFIG